MSMPFVDEHGKFPNPDLQFLGTREFRLTTEFSYRLPGKAGTEFRVAPMKTDLASIPGPLWGLAGPYGKQILPVLLHDALCNEAKELNSFDRRKHADDTFRIALGDQGDGRRDVSRIRSRVLWVGVSMDRYWQYSRIRLWAIVVPFLLIAIVAVLAIPIFVHAQFNNWWLAAGAWLLVLTIVQIFGSVSKSDSLPVLILVGAAVAPPVVLIMTLTFATTVILNAVPWLVLWALPWAKQGPSPELGPTTVGRATSATPVRRASAAPTVIESGTMLPPNPEPSTAPAV